MAVHIHFSNRKRKISIMNNNRSTKATRRCLSERFRSAVNINGTSPLSKPIRPKRLFDSIDESPKTRLSISEETPKALDQLLTAPLKLTPKRLFDSSPEPEVGERTSATKRRFADDTPTPNKRMKSTFRKYKSDSEIETALSKEDNQLLGDFSRDLSLPTVKGKHSDLRSISPETLSNLFKGEFADKIEEYVIVDCRYPYEYEGGHLPGAKNLWTQGKVMELLNNPRKPQDSCKRSVIIFHCEFSSERGPKMSRFLRSQDRVKNAENYPQLCYPEVYLLDGGYKNFFESCPDYDLTYLPMLHEEHSQDLRKYRTKSKASKLTGRKPQSRRNIDLPRAGLKF